MLIFHFQSCLKIEQNKIQIICSHQFFETFYLFVHFTRFYFYVFIINFCSYYVAGTFFSDLALVDDENSDLTLIATTDTECFTLTRSAFEEIIGYKKLELIHRVYTGEWNRNWNSV